MAKAIQTSERLFAQSIPEVTESILATGSIVTTLVVGHMGTGKSSILKMLAEKLPNHVPCYFDCTTKDLGDLMMPKILDMGDDAQFVRFVPNEEMGIHHDQPIILMIDEFGKANPSVKNGMMRLMLERTLGTKKLHKDSIVFATTNLGAEGVGDLLMPHHRNRITTIRLKKPTATEWIDNFAINNGIHPSLIMWVKEHGEQLFQSFEDVDNPDDEVGGNPYIYHPKTQRPAFVTPRSLELASHWLWAKDRISENALKSNLIGTIGDRGGMDLGAYIRLVDDLPKQEEIKQDPKNAKIPQSASAVCMVVYRALATMDRSWVDAWLDYLPRLDKAAQGLFAMQVRNPNYKKQSIVMTNAKFTKWAMDNNYMFTADKV
jgi:ATPase family associated with various cellular activities (AAA)